MKIIFFSTIVWNFYKARPQELPIALSEYYHHKCTYVEPYVYKNYTTNRLNDLSDNDKRGIEVVKRKTSLQKGFLLFILENVNNLYLIVKLRPDIVVSNDYLMSLPSVLFCRLMRKKFIFDHIDNWLGLEKNKLTRFYLRYINYPLTGTLSFATINTSYYLQTFMQKYTKKSYFAPNGKSLNDIDKFKNMSQETANEVFFIGSLRDWYDFDLLLDVFKKLPSLTLHMYGYGESVEYIEKKINREKISNVKMHGNIDGSQVPQLTAKSNFGIIPLKDNLLNKGTCPIKLFDYWAARKAVIATPTYELKKIGQDCILFAETREEWISQIKKLTTDQDLRKKLGEISYEKIMNTYNYKKISEKFEKILMSSHNTYERS